MILIALCNNNFIGDNYHFNGVNNITLHQVDTDFFIKSGKNLWDRMKKTIMGIDCSQITNTPHFYKIMAGCIFIYFIIGNYFNKIATKIVNSDFYFLCKTSDYSEIEAIARRIQGHADINFITEMKKIKKNIDFLFNYRYLIGLFIFFPFFHGNFKRVILTISKLYDNIKTLDEIIINKKGYIV